MRRIILPTLVILVAFTSWSLHVQAQSPGVENDADASARAEQALEEAPPPEVEETPANVGSPSFYMLLSKGGWLMAPIVLMSILVVAMGVERAIGLRRGRILPEELIAGLGGLAATSSKFDPQRAYRLCQEYPSTASTIVRTMLLKMGRPHHEVETAVSEASQREADRLYTNVRTLNLAAAVTPLLGLLGTVWGMIQSFYSTANLPAGANKAEALAEGIYVALVTTFAGLAVAIPAAVLAHFFEGRIRSRLMQIDELMLTLLPQVERFEGKRRVNQQQLDEGRDSEAVVPGEKRVSRPSAKAR